VTVTDKDISYLSKKLNLSEEKTLCLIDDPEAVEKILIKVAQEDLHGGEVLDISFPLYTCLCILKYSEDLKYDFNEKEYISDTISKKYPTISKDKLEEEFILNIKKNEDTAQYFTVFLGFFHKKLDRPRRCYPDQKIYYTIAKEGYKNSNRENIAYHLNNWIKVLRRINTEIWF